MKETLSKLNDWITLITQVGVALIALSVVVEIVFGTNAVFGGGVITNLSEIVKDVGGVDENGQGGNGFVGLVAILVILALVRGRVTSKA
ncbi:MAG: hypothetical protein CMI30_07005 [Opitutae bacterium]|jgi:hypothetical protein|nr:hypothetical protein [Opitutae bacterium]|tara:strand:+ start:5896 stop:6162 length:267 start_codon:yes stop_codon:yes gene_type:complete